MAQVQVFIVGMWEEEAGMLLVEWNGKRENQSRSQNTLCFSSVLDGVLTTGSPDEYHPFVSKFPP